MTSLRQQALPAGVRCVPFGTTTDGRDVDLYTLTNAHALSLSFLTLGGIIVSLRVPDRDGALADIVLGHDTLADYEADPRYFGALIGRYANRIPGGRFEIDGAEYRVETNNGTSHLHGGPGGFHAAVWRAEAFADDDGVGAALHHVSPDGDEGYPGTLAVRVRYTLTHDDALVVDYRATTDRATPVNLTQHTYFNLAGHDAGDVGAHVLTLHASRYTPVNDALIPTGELASVAGTPFDFTSPHVIGARVGDDDVQLARGDGYDHNFVIDNFVTDGDAAALRDAARLYDPATGRVLDVLTTEPGIQVYAGGGLAAGPPGKGGRPYGRRGGVALETQHFPDSPNQPCFPSTILRPGEAYTSRTVFRFSTRPRRRSAP